MMSKQHHPSCSESDRDLVWHCSQCGLNEPVEPTRWTWEQEGTSVLVSVNEENGDRCYFHCTNERWAKLAVESHNAAIAAERNRAEQWKQLHAEISEAWLAEKTRAEGLEALAKK